MFACLPDIISNFGLTCTDTSERRNTLRFISAAASEYPSFRFRYASTAEACTAGFLLYVKKRAFCRQGRRTGGMPFALFPPRKRDGGRRCRIPPLRQKAGFLPVGRTERNDAGFRLNNRKTHLSIVRSRPEMDAPRRKRRAREWRGRRRDLRCRIPPFRQKAGFLPEGRTGRNECITTSAEATLPGTIEKRQEKGAWTKGALLSCRSPIPSPITMRVS